jgi:hypothetical protein
VRWSDWGAKTATGHGVDVYCNQGCRTSRVTVTVYDLRTAAGDPAVLVYSRLRLVERRQVVEIIGQQPHPVRVVEPGYTAVFDVVPDLSAPMSGS